VKTFQYMITVECDEKALPTKYPNWRWNYQNAHQFARARAMEFSAELLESFGYRITVRPIGKNLRVDNS
jgi:hypothetical protein